VEKKNEITNMKRVEVSNINDEEVIYKALGYSLFELLRPINVIFEGWRDKFVFNKALENPKAQKIFSGDKCKKAGLLHAMGVKDVDRVANICENFDRKYIVITDSDKPAKEKKKVFKGMGKWNCYDDIDSISVITTEDFINNTLINKSIKNVIDREKLNFEVSIDEGILNDKINIISNQLKQKADKELDLGRIMNLIKEEICTLLTKDDISDEYLKIIQNIADFCKA
jgi:hypothetical protein